MLLAVASRWAAVEGSPFENLLVLSCPVLLWDPSSMEESKKHEIPVWLGWESGQRKRYLRSLEQDLAREFGPDWREKIQTGTVAA